MIAAAGSDFYLKYKYYVKMFVELANEMVISPIFTKNVSKNEQYFVLLVVLIVNIQFILFAKPLS